MLFPIVIILVCSARKPIERERYTVYVQVSPCFTLWGIACSYTDTRADNSRYAFKLKGLEHGHVSQRRKWMFGSRYRSPEGAKEKKKEKIGKDQQGELF